MDTGNRIRRIIFGVLGIGLIAVIVGMTFRCRFELDCCCVFMYGILGAICQLVITCVFKCGLLYRIQKYTGRKIDLLLDSHFSDFFKYAWMIFSFDYAIADCNKDRLPRYARTYYITTSNKYNLIISAFLTVIVFILVSLCNCQQFVIFFCAVIFARFISRTMEINIAFFNDILSSEKRSSLTKSKRIMLAIKSLLEEAILFAAVYYIFAKDPASSKTIIESILDGLQSLTLNGDAGCCCCTRCVVLKIITAYQGISAIILLTLSVATYISSDYLKGKSYFELLHLNNSFGAKGYVTNTAETYSADEYELCYSEDGYVEYVVSKVSPKNVIITRVLYKNDKLDFSDYVCEIKKKIKDEEATITLANGALKTAVGTRKVYIPAELNYFPCSFARLFTLWQVVLEKPIPFFKKHYFHRFTRIYDCNGNKQNGQSVDK